MIAGTPGDHPSGTMANRCSWTSVPLEPLIVALLLGVVTDYVIFFLSAYGRRLHAGDASLPAAQRATAEFAPIVLAAGLTVSAGTAALLAARSDFFRAFGPGMALAVLTGVAVAITLVPALLAILGPAVFWPSRPAPADESASEIPGPAPSRFFRRAFRGRAIHLLAEPRSAATTLAATRSGS